MQQGRGTAPLLRPILMREVTLIVVLGDLLIMDHEELRPGSCFGEIMIAQPSLDPEIGLDIVLPRLSPPNRFGLSMVGPEATVRAGRRWLLGEDSLDGMGTRAVAEACPANRGQLVDVERWMFALGIEECLANFGWKQPVLLWLRRRDEAGHPKLP